MLWLGLWSRVLIQTREPAFNSGVSPFQSEWQPGGVHNVQESGDRSGLV